MARGITLLERKCQRILSEEHKKLIFLKKAHRKEAAKVYLQYKDGKPYFCERLNGKSKGITGQAERIEELAISELNEKRIKVMECNYNTLRLAVKRMKRIDNERIEKILEAQGMSAILYTGEQKQWMNKAYKRNQFNVQDLIYQSPMGTKVRSKSERQIAGRLEANRIAYRYEMAMELGPEEGFKTVYPDFVIRKDDGELVIWEHFGLMNNEQYHQKAVEKIEKYRAIGYVQHKNLICTWEEDLVDNKEIDSIIERFLI